MATETDAEKLKQQFPEFQIVERMLFKVSATTKREKSAIKLAEGQTTELVVNEDKSCGLIKVLSIQPNAKMRVSYIYLGDSTKEGEQLADKVLQEYKNGNSFASLAKEYSKDGNAKNGGDLNWFDEDHMVKDFTQAIRNHKKGDVFKANTKQFGWYVISYTHAIEERIEYEIIEVKKENASCYSTP